MLACYGEGRVWCWKKPAGRLREAKQSLYWDTPAYTPFADVTYNKLN